MSDSRPDHAAVRFARRRPAWQAAPSPAAALPISGATAGSSSSERLPLACTGFREKTLPLRFRPQAKIGRTLLDTPAVAPRPCGIRPRYVLLLAALLFFAPRTAGGASR